MQNVAISVSCLMSNISLIDYSCFKKYMFSEFIQKHFKVHLFGLELVNQQVFCIMYLFFPIVLTLIYPTPWISFHLQWWDIQIYKEIGLNVIFKFDKRQQIEMANYLHSGLQIYFKWVDLWSNLPIMGGTVTWFHQILVLYVQFSLHTAFYWVKKKAMYQT